MCPRGARLLAGHGGLLETTKIVAHCLLIEAGGELVLVDTGFGVGDCSNPKRLGAPFRAMVAPICEERESAVRQIEALGHHPADVRHIITTHLDLDHAGGIGDFPDAQIHVFASELAFGVRLAMGTTGGAHANKNTNLVVSDHPLPVGPCGPGGHTGAGVDDFRQHSAGATRVLQSIRGYVVRAAVAGWAGS
jgi:hypothetical protein